MKQPGRRDGTAAKTTSTKQTTALNCVHPVVACITCANLIKFENQRSPRHWMQKCHCVEAIWSYPYGQTMKRFYVKLQWWICIKINGPKISMTLLNMKHLQWNWRVLVGSTSGPCCEYPSVSLFSFPSLFHGKKFIQETPWVFTVCNFFGALGDGGNGSWWCSPQIRGGWTLGSLAVWNR